MKNKKSEISEPLFEETLDFSELSCLKGGLDGSQGWSIGDHCCSGSGKAFYDKEKQEFAKEPNENNCDFMRLYLEKVILFITNIRKNQELWLKLIEYAKSIN